MKLFELVNAREALQKLYAVDLDGLRTYKLMGVIEQIDKQLTTFEEARNEFIKKNVDEDGQKIKEEKIPELNDFLNEMGQVEVALVGMDGPFVEIEDFDKISGIHLKQLIELGFIKEPVPEE